jgi:23S rRNA pseudouridine955/2504/2580 synthase
MMRAMSDDAGSRLRLVHRIDKDTSGVLLLAKTIEAARSLT